MCVTILRISRLNQDFYLMILKYELWNLCLLRIYCIRFPCIYHSFPTIVSWFVEWHNTIYTCTVVQYIYSKYKKFTGYLLSFTDPSCGCIKSSCGSCLNESVIGINCLFTISVHLLNYISKLWTLRFKLFQSFYCNVILSEILWINWFLSWLI